MALWYCTECTAAYAVGLKACPQCGANDPAAQPVRELEVDAEASAELAGAGPAENLATGEVTPAGQPLPEIPPEADATPLAPTALAAPARRRKKANGG